ncbi:hypothetical protein V6N13_024530 [Hibiscus sabdariffa]
MASHSAQPSVATAASATFHQFSIIDVEKRYEKSFKGQIEWEEQGFVSDDTNDRFILEPSLYAKIEYQNWQTFATQPDKENTDWVKEYYAHRPNANNPYVYVRGRHVPFHTAVVNSYYNLPRAADKHSQFASRLTLAKYDAIKDELCEANTEWNIKNNPGIV